MHEKVINLNVNSMSNSFLIVVLTNVTYYYHSNSPWKMHLTIISKFQSTYFLRFSKYMHSILKKLKEKKNNNSLYEGLYGQTHLRERQFLEKLTGQRYPPW